MIVKLSDHIILYSYITICIPWITGLGGSEVRMNDYLQIKNEFKCLQETCTLNFHQRNKKATIILYQLYYDFTSYNDRITFVLNVNMINNFNTGRL